jgi:hypothetical protein
MTINKVYKLITELEEKEISKESVNKIVKTRQNNINTAKNNLKKYGINLKYLDNELKDFVNKVLRGSDHNINKQLEILTKHLQLELDKINDSKLVKIVILNIIVYVLNYLIYFLFEIGLRKLRIPKAETIATIITSFIISPITDEIAFKVEEKGDYESSIFSKYGSRLVTGLIHKLVFSLHAPTSSNQLIIALSGIIINKLKWLFKEELDIPIIESAVIEIRKLIYNCYLIIFKFLKIFGSLIPGGG